MHKLNRKISHIGNLFSRKTHFSTDIDDGFFTTGFLKTMGAELKNAGPDPQWIDIIRKTKGETSTMAVKYKSAQNIIFKVCTTKDNGACVEDVGAKMVK